MFGITRMTRCAGRQRRFNGNRHASGDGDEQVVGGKTVAHITECGGGLVGFDGGKMTRADLTTSMFEAADLPPVSFANASRAVLMGSLAKRLAGSASLARTRPRAEPWPFPHAENRW